MPRSLLSSLPREIDALKELVECLASLFQLLITSLEVFSEEQRLRVVAEVNEHAPPRIFFLGKLSLCDLLADTIQEVIDLALEVASTCNCSSGCFECVHATHDCKTEKRHVVAVLKHFQSKRSGDL